MSHRADKFKSDHVYKISSFVDGTVIDLEGAKLKDKVKVLTWAWNGNANQKWKAADESNGYRIATAVKGDSMKVLHEYNGGLVVYAFNGEAAQQWRTVPVKDDAGGDAVYIQNINSGHCLRNMGSGKQVACTEQGYDDKSQWWYLGVQ